MGNIPNFFYWDLPYQTAIKNNKIDKNSPFFIFPTPPNKRLAEKSPIAHNTLTLTFQRLEGIAKIKDNNYENTVEKFNALKDLYNTIYEKYESSTSPNLNDLLSQINEWENKDNNKELIDTRRGTESFLYDWLYSAGIFQTSTRQTIDLIRSEIDASLNEREFSSTVADFHRHGSF